MIELTDLHGVPYYQSDDDIRRILNWFMSFMHPADWTRRKKTIERKIKFEYHNPMFKGKSLSNMVALSNDEDTIGWYLYLAEKLLTDPQQYEVVQGARGKGDTNV